MKTIVLFLVLFPACFISHGQNLVPNGSFELYSGCPTFYTQIDCVLYWTNTALWPGPGGSPDYFNSCATPASNVDVPNNIFGYQQAHTGNAYCGITLWDLNNLFREYIQVPLTSTLEAECYQFEMYVNLANKYKYTAAPIGVYFSNTPITGIPNFLPLPNIPQINITGFITDTLNWILISGNYTASGNENYLIIGNFNDNSGTISTFVNNTGVYDQSYIFIDDVSLTLCAASSIDDYDDNVLFTVYPNPVTGHQLQINVEVSADTGGSFEMFDVSGRKIYSTYLPLLNSGIINLPGLKQGIYQCIISYGSKRLSSKVAILIE